MKRCVSMHFHLPHHPTNPQNYCCCSVTQSCLIFETSWTPGFIPRSSQSSGACSNPSPSSWWHHTTILSSVVPFSCCLESCPASWVNSPHQVVKVLEPQPQHQSLQWILRTHFLYDWLVWSHWCSKDSKESSPTPEFKSINSSALSFLYGPTPHPYMITGKTIDLTK